MMKMIIFGLFLPMLAATHKTWNRLDNCTVNAKPVMNACPDIKQLDLAIVIDDTIYQSYEYEFEGEKYVNHYQEFLKYFMDSTSFSYGPNGVRRMIIKTDWQNGYIVVQNFSHGEFKSNREDDLLKPYQNGTYQRSDSRYRRNETRLGEVFEYMQHTSIYEKAESHGLYQEKVVLVLTRGTRSDEDFNSFALHLEQLSQKLGKNMFIYIIHFYSATDEIFATETRGGNKHDLSAYDISESKVSIKSISVEKPLNHLTVKSIAHCICDFTEDCQSEYKQTPCHYIMNGTTEKCQKIESRETIRNENSSTWHCNPPFPQRSVTCEDSTECDKDCDMKGWTEWSTCLNKTYRVRKRNNTYASLSQYTTSCEFLKNESCVPPEVEKNPLEPSKFPWQVVVGVLVTAISIIVILVVVAVILIKRSNSRLKNVAKCGSVRQSSIAKSFAISTPVNGLKSTAKTQTPSPDRYIQTVPGKSTVASPKPAKVSYIQTVPGKSTVGSPKLVKASYIQAIPRESAFARQKPKKKASYTITKATDSELTGQSTAAKAESKSVLKKATSFTPGSKSQEYLLI